ncbi:hypothetical protein [Cryptosporangium minutisporangium]|uniref:hypothetical protein n=1 Tax=Cryptosporangium minutisporangium TaxID=113569 RepID=UPI0035EFAC32
MTLPLGRPLRGRPRPLAATVRQRSAMPLLLAATLQAHAGTLRQCPTTPRLLAVTLPRCPVTLPQWTAVQR